MPGGKICSVAICKSNSKKAKETGEDIMFFSFPKDPEVRKEWIRKCYRKDNFSVENKRVCSKHFKSDDFEDELKARLMGIQAKTLKNTAIPSLLLLPQVSCHTKLLLSKRSTRAEKKERQAWVESLIAETSKVDEHELELLEPEVQQTQEREDVYTESSYSKNSDVLEQLHILQQENFQLRDKVQQHEENSEVLKNHIKALEKRLKESDCSFEVRAKIAFKNFLTPNQIAIALKKKTRARWTTEEFSRAFTIRYLGKRSYIYLRETLKYPLPGISTLQKWAANINLRSGVLHDVLRIMETTGSYRNSYQKTTVLSFDEVKVASLYEYDQKDDEVVGPHSYMQVIMARGLFDSWKQPVYIGFDEKMTKELLDSVANLLNQIHYNVVACVSDCGGGNQGLWKALDVDINKSFYPHPTTQEPIFFFADAPHLLKLARNWFIDTGFVLGDGKPINKGPIQKLLKDTKTEVSSCHKLTDLHINCDKTQRQNVKLAAQLFSNTSATALKFYKPDGDGGESGGDLSNFVELMNNWFDVMNSYTPSPKVPSKRPYGFDIEQQDKILDEMKSTAGNMLCVGKTSLQVFQKSMIMSIRSLKELFLHLKEKLEISYILTHRLNQDCLENFFSQLRTRGGLHDHPSPLNSLYRIRMILLGKNPGMVQSHTNVEANTDTDPEEYLVATALKQANITNISVDPVAAGIQTFPSALDDIESSSSSSSSQSRASTRRGAMEKDGLLYLAGYIAKQNLTAFPQLGEYTHKMQTINMHSYSMPSWIQSLSFGGLIQPSKEWSSQFEKLEKYFLKFHKDKIRSGKNVVWRTLRFILKKVPDVPEVLVKSFCRLRLIIRIRYLNKKREELKSCKRKRSPTRSERKISKKMKKILN